jgi:hypothetical protein
VKREAAPGGVGGVSLLDSGDAFVSHSLGRLV